MAIEGSRRDDTADAGVVILSSRISPSSRFAVVISAPFTNVSQSSYLFWPIHAITVDE